MRAFLTGLGVIAVLAVGAFVVYRLGAVSQIERYQSASVHVGQDHIDSYYIIKH